jgi:hypothetical protein
MYDHCPGPWLWLATQLEPTTNCELCRCKEREIYIYIHVHIYLYIYTMWYQKINVYIYNVLYCIYVFGESPRLGDIHLWPVISQEEYPRHRPQMAYFGRQYITCCNTGKKSSNPEMKIQITAFLFHTACVCCSIFCLLWFNSTCLLLQVIILAIFVGWCWLSCAELLCIYVIYGCVWRLSYMTREHHDWPMDFGAPYFQTKPDMVQIP